MDKWSVNLGIVDLWDEVDEIFNEVSLKISYNSSEVFSYYIEGFVDGELRATAMGKNLVVEFKDDGIIVLDDTVIRVSEEQKSLLLSQGKWEYKPISRQVNVVNYIPSEMAKDFGIVFFYDLEADKFVTATLLIDFDWNCSEPIIMVARTYDDDNYPKDQLNGRFSGFTYNYEGEIQGLSHYSICENHFLLTGKQVGLLTNIAGMLSK